ncbi:MAG: hypothetical protein IT546_08015 [Caulobacteraceae bacterium]|nr:hypothetical protein [Caulobacteraceae bacterium]
MNRRLVRAVLASTAIALPSAAWAQCATVDPIVVPPVRIDALDASGPGELAQPFVLTFRRTGVGTDPIALRYQIVDEDSSVRSRVGLTRGPIVEWQSPDSSRYIGSSRSEAYSLLRSGQIVLEKNQQAVQRDVVLRLVDLRNEDFAAGVYREQFTVRFWCGDNEQTIPFETQGAIAVSVAVPNVLSANVAGASAAGQIDFQDFALRSRTLQISVRSTGPYRVTARSLNGGELRRETAVSATSADRIRYVAALDGEALAVDGGSAQVQARAGLAGRQMPLEVNVESVADKHAGTYADTLLLTLMPAN